MLGVRLGVQLLACLVIHVVGVSGVGSLPNVTHSGYLEVDKEDGSHIFYTYYEAQGKVDKNTPILLWLQVRYLTQVMTRTRCRHIAAIES